MAVIIPPRNLKAHSGSQYEWMCTDKHVLDHLDYRQIPVLYHSEKSKKLHRLNFFRLLFLRNELPIDAEAIINVWHNSYVKDFHEWMHELKQSDEEWMETINGLKFHINLGSIREDIPCAVRVEFGCTHCRKSTPKLYHFFRSRPEYISLSRRLRTAIGKLDDLFAQFALEYPKITQPTLVEQKRRSKGGIKIERSSQGIWSRNSRRLLPDIRAQLRYCSNVSSSWTSV